MHQWCQPLVFVIVGTTTGDVNNINIFRGVFCMEAISKNALFVRSLTLNRLDAAYMYNCFLAYHKTTTSQTVVTLISSNPGVSSSSSWPPPANPMSFPNVPIAPMSNLTELYIDLDRATEQRRWGFIYHSRKYHLATFSQVCWMIQLSPHLVKLRMGHLELESVWQVWFLIGIIAGMAWLEALSFTISLDTSSSRPDWFTLWLAILQSTLPSLNQFCLDLGYNFSGSSSSDNDGDGVFGGKEMTMERPQRQETVPGLTELDMPRLEDPTVVWPQ